MKTINEIGAEMTGYVAYEGKVCGDCMRMIAHADSSGIEDLAEWARRVYTHDPTEGCRYQVVMARPEDREGAYGTSPCGYCGTKLHGERHLAAWLADESAHGQADDEYFETQGSWLTRRSRDLPAPRYWPGSSAG